MSSKEGRRLVSDSRQGSAQNGPTLWDRFKEAQNNQPSLGAELKAMVREAAKDVRSTMNQFFFGRPDGPGEPGTPLNPTPQQVTKDLGNVYATQEKPKLMTTQESAAPAPEQAPQVQEHPQPQQPAPGNAQQIDAVFDGYASRGTRERERQKGMER
jgi:hypothetical protein